MGSIQQFWIFIQENQVKLGEQILEHIGLTFISLTLAVVIALPIGIWITRKEQFSAPVLGLAGVLQTIPSIALLGFLLPVLGIGIKPAIVALFLYALLPILRNTYTGIQDVDASVKDAAKGMGMKDWQVLTQVELPLALPVIFAGIRTATVINVGVATLAAYIGAGGLGEFIFGGIALNNTQMILAGAIPSALLAVVFDQLLGWLQRFQVKKLFRASRVTLILMPLLAGAYMLPDFFQSGLSAGFEPEFVGRRDGYPSLEKTYGISFNTVVLNNALMYKAVKEGYVDVISGYATDGRIKAFNLAVLEDDQHAFPPYFCTPLISKHLEEGYPGVTPVLNLLANKINDSIMTELNYQVDFEKKSPSEVAEAFLVSQDLWQPDRSKGGKTFTIGSKIFTEQYILANLYAQLIGGYTDYEVDLKLGLGGTKICFDALQQGEIQMYPEYTGTGFLVLLEPEEQLVGDIIDNPKAVYDYVDSEFDRLYELDWLDPLGFNNTYALMMREASSEALAVRKLSDLVSQ